jgi:CheY-like chemotaxis protein
MAKILVVDDEPDIIRFVTKILESRGHQVVTASDGPDALMRVTNDAPDVVVLDLNIPRMDGFEVCRAIKTDPATKHIPVVMMTAAYVRVEDADHGTNLGADEYVIKPFLREVLIHNVERLLPAPAAASKA